MSIAPPAVPTGLGERLSAGRTAAVAARLRCTEGELQGGLIVLALAVLVTVLAIPAVHSGSVAAAPRPRAASASPPDRDPAPTTLATTVLRPVPEAPPSVDGAPTTTTTRPGPVAPECPAGPELEQLGVLLEPLEPLLAGLLPSERVVGVIASLTGCSPEQVSDALLALVYAVGDQLRSSGLFPDLDVLPPLPLLPQGALGPLAPVLAPVVAPVCEQVPTLLVALNAIGAHLPATVVSSDLLGLILYVGIACGALHPSTP